MKGKPTNERPTSESSQPIQHGTESSVRVGEGQMPQRTIQSRAEVRNVLANKRVRQNVRERKYISLLVSFNLSLRLAVSAAAAAEGPLLDECRGNYDCPGDQICAEFSSISHDHERIIEGSPVGALGNTDINFFQNIAAPQRPKTNPSPRGEEGKPDPSGKWRSNQVKL